MAFDPEAKLSDVLAGGYQLSAKLQGLLGRPIDSRSQEEAMAFSQELSRVFMVSISMLKTNDTKRTLKTMAPDIRTANSFGVCTLPKVIRNGSREVVTSHKNIREAEFTRKEVTSEPHKDGYQWQKYGQKNIQNCRFMRHYFKCHDRRCNARKKVQQQDDSDDAPMFEVTYVNDHTCHHHVALANDVPVPPSTGQTCLKAAAEKAGRNGGPLFDLLQFQENEAIVSCLATVISGTAPGAEPGDPPAASVPHDQLQADGKQTTPSKDDGAMMIGTGLIWWNEGPPSPSSFWPTDTEATELMMDLSGDDEDVHMGTARFADGTVWPQYDT